MELRLGFLEFLHLLFQCFDFFFQSLSLGLGYFWHCPIRRIHRRQISINALLDLLHACLHLALSEVAVAIIDGLNFLPSMAMNAQTHTLKSTKTSSP